MARAPFLVPLLVFAVIAYGFTWLVMTGSGNEALAAFGPTVAALTLLWAARGGDRDAFTAWRRRLWRWPTTRAGWGLTLAAPFGFLAVAMLAAATMPGGLDFGRLQSGPLATQRGLFHLLVIGSLLQAAGEEPGWRGWFLPKLRERFGAVLATLLLFPVWLFWHLPMFLARPEFGLPQFAGFALGILSAAVWLTAIYEITGSILAAFLFHFLINATRGVALAISTPAFLAYGMAVTVGALAIALFYASRSRRIGR